MSALVGYESSDEEVAITPERQTKIPKLDSAGPQVPSEHTYAPAPAAAQDHSALLTTPPPAWTGQLVQHEHLEREVPLGPAPFISDSPRASYTPSEIPLSPYASERQRLRDLTMPSVPNFDIPDSPPPPLRNSEEAAGLAAITKKLERFLELKRQNVHFNERLQHSTSLRNPSLLPKLMEFAGISQEESYASALPDELAVPVRWQQDSYVEGLVRQNERQEKRRLAERDNIAFVSAAKSAESSTGTTPVTAGVGSVKGRKRSRFDKR